MTPEIFKELQNKFPEAESLTLELAATLLYEFRRFPDNFSAAKIRELRILLLDLEKHKPGKSDGIWDGLLEGGGACKQFKHP